MKNPWVITGVALLALFAGAFWLADQAAERNNEGVTINQNIKGNSEASVTLVEFSDFQCPACQAFQPAINQALALYGDSFQLEYKHFPLPRHRFAVSAAVAAEAAGQQGKFFEFHDKLFENQSTWSSAAAPNVFFLQYAEEIGLDVDQFNRHLKSTILNEKVQSDRQEALALGVNATPTFFLNGERMQIQTFEDFLSQIEAAVSAPVTENVDASADVNFGF